MGSKSSKNSQPEVISYTNNNAVVDQRSRSTIQIINPNKAYNDIRITLRFQYIVKDSQNIVYPMFYNLKNNGFLIETLLFNNNNIKDIKISNNSKPFHIIVLEKDHYSIKEVYNSDEKVDVYNNSVVMYKSSFPNKNTTISNNDFIISFTYKNKIYQYKLTVTDNDITQGLLYKFKYTLSNNNITRSFNPNFCC